IMKIRFQDTFLHITAIGTLILTLLVGGLAGLFYAFIFGICLGHQVFARSQGVSTYKMHNGHRGINHPVLNLETGKCEITSQNHGFSIKRNDVEENNKLEITHINLNDDTVEGIKHKTLPAFSVQYHPEAAPGPNDSKYLFDQFLNLIKK
ncbi:MAG: glutamine amidotransferase-related protein, partial [Bacteroidia bacterium]